MAATITELRYLKQTNLQSEQKIYREYFRDLIHAHGVDVTYFRKDLSFFEVPSGLANYTYGEDTTATYYLSAPMVVYIDITNDGFVLNNMGIETRMDITISMTTQDFNEQYRDLVGTLTSGYVSSLVSANIYNYSATVSGTFNISGEYSGLSGMTSGSIDLSSSTSGIITPAFSGVVAPYFKPVNPNIKLVHYYNYNYTKTATGNLSGNLSGYIDASGNGFVSGIVGGAVNYFAPPMQNYGPGWDYNIAPQVGDFFRIDFSPENHEEYELTEVNDRKLTTDGLNPLLYKYCWRCTSVRRDPSKEDVMGIEEQEEQTTDKLEENATHEIVSNAIFQYQNPIDQIDSGANNDQRYGGYGNY